MDHPPMPPLTEPVAKRPVVNSQKRGPQEQSNYEETPAPVMPIVPPMMSSPVVGTMPPPPVSVAPVDTSPIIPEASRASTSSPTEATSAPPPSTSTSICSDYAPPPIAGTDGLSGAPLFGTNSTPFLPPENMVVPDPAVLAGMPPPPALLPDFANISINGMPTPPTAPLSNVMQSTQQAEAATQWNVSKIDLVYNIDLPVRMRIHIMIFDSFWKIDFHFFSFWFWISRSF